MTHSNKNDFLYLSYKIQESKLTLHILHNAEQFEVEKLAYKPSEMNRFSGKLHQLRHDRILVVWDLKTMVNDLLAFFDSNQLCDRLIQYRWLDIKLAAYLDESLTEPDFTNLISSVLKQSSTVVHNAGSNEGFFEQDDENLTLTHLKQIAELHQHYYTKFENQQPRVLQLWQTMETPLAIVLADMERSGIYVDKQELERLKSLMHKEMEDLEAVITGYLGQININSPSQLGSALASKGYFLKQSKKTGNYSTSRQVLEELLAQDSSGIVLRILQYRTVSKLYGTYINAFLTLPDSKGRIHCQFNQTAASTGRLSSNNPNLQNIPVKNEEYGTAIRACFQAEQGRVLLSCDYSQIELRLLAHFSGDQRLLKSFADGEDIHKRTAAEIFGIGIEDVDSAKRRLGKTLNFALIYQQGSFATARMLGLDLKEAEEFIRKYFASFPAVKPFIEQTLNQARELGYVESLYGRRRWFPNIKSPVFALRQAEERAAFNMALQGSNADLIKIAMLRIYDQIDRRNLDAKILLQIHDELVLEVDEDQADRVRDLVIDVMSNPEVDLKVPILVEGSYSRQWSK